MCTRPLPDDAPDESAPAAEQTAAESETDAESPPESPAASEDAADEPEPPKFDDTPWELRPYRVLISVSFADRGSMDETFVSTTLETLNLLIEGAIGPYWQPSYEVNGWLYPQTASRIEALTAEELTDRYRSSEIEKAIHLVLETDGPGYHLSGCEWDRSNESRGQNTSP